MTHTTLSSSLSFMFADEDWFWKVSLGALALLLTGTGIGYFFVIGYHVETVRRYREHESTLPEWNRPGTLWRSGLRVGIAMVCYTTLVVASLASVHQIGALTIGICILLTHTVVLPFVVLQFLKVGSLSSCFALPALTSIAGRNIFASVQKTAMESCILLAVASFGWMALIVGWPFFIFWGILASASLTASLTPFSEIN